MHSLHPRVWEEDEASTNKMKKELQVRQEESQQSFMSWKPRKENVSKRKEALIWLDDAENQ